MISRTVSTKKITLRPARWLGWQGSCYQICASGWTISLYITQEENQLSRLSSYFHSFPTTKISLNSQIYSLSFILQYPTPHLTFSSTLRYVKFIISEVKFTTTSPSMPSVLKGTPLLTGAHSLETAFQIVSFCHAFSSS